LKDERETKNPEMGSKEKVATAHVRICCTGQKTLGEQTTEYCLTKCEPFFWVWGVIRSRKNKLYEEEGEEEVDEVVPEGVEEVELARIKVEQAQRECRLLFRDLRMLRCSDCGTRDVGTVWSPKAEEETLWMISSARSILVSN